MSIEIPGIHPETLIDKFAAGSLTEAERELLQKHLQGCAVCRFELTVRADFADEADALEAAPLDQLPAAFALTGSMMPGSMPAPERRPPTKRATRARRALTLGAAAVALASGAAALVGVLPATSAGGASSAAPVGHPRRSDSVVAKLPQSKAPPAPKATPARASLEVNAAKPKPKLSASDRPSRIRASARPQPAATPAESAPMLEAEEPSDAPNASQLFSEANRARRASDLSRATELYRQLQREYPGSEEALLSLVTLGSLQLDTGNASAALRAFNRYLRQSGLPLEAEALYGRARALGHLGQQGEETRAWKTLLARHPSSGYAKQARERLSALSAP